MIQLSINNPNITLYLDAIFMGKDLSISVYGGEAHIGAVAIAQPRPSLSDSAKNSASTSIFTVVGHKEDILARYIAETICKITQGVVSVSCGIHIDQASLEQIETIKTLTEQLIEQLIIKIEMINDQHL